MGASGRARPFPVRMQGWPLVAFASLVTLVLVLLATRGGGAAEHSLVQTYRLGDVEPKHLDIIRAGVGYHPAPRCLFTRCTALPIHAVHVEGRPHGGMWLNIVSSDGMLLMLKRGPELKTCPNTWGLLGEHQAAGEEWLALAKRALREELGPEVSPIISTSSNISESPVYYYRKYADGRQDKQITYLWCVRLSELSAEVRLQPDEEVAEYKWISPSDARRWVADKPEDFCAATPTTKLDVDTTPTVVSLMNLDLDLLERYLSAHDWDTPTIKRSAIWENSLVDRNSPTGLSKRSAYDRDENPNGDDMTVVVEGRVTYHFFVKGIDGKLAQDGEALVLKQGDTGYIAANRIHSTVCDESCKLVYVHDKGFGLAVY